MKDFYKVTAELLDSSMLDYGCGEDELEDKCCLYCPLHYNCVHNQLFYGCCCWEQSMGEDL